MIDDGWMDNNRSSSRNDNEESLYKCYVCKSHRNVDDKFPYWELSESLQLVMDNDVNVILNEGRNNISRFALFVTPSTSNCLWDKTVF